MVLAKSCRTINEVGNCCKGAMQKLHLRGELTLEGCILGASHGEKGRTCIQFEQLNPNASNKTRSFAARVVISSVPQVKTTSTHFGETQLWDWMTTPFSMKRMTSDLRFLVESE